MVNQSIPEILALYDRGAYDDAAARFESLATLEALPYKVLLPVQTLGALLRQFLEMSHRGEAPTPAFEICAIDLEIGIGTYGEALARSSGLIREASLTRSNLHQLMISLCNLYEFSGCPVESSLFATKILQRLTQEANQTLSLHPTYQKYIFACEHALGQKDCDPVWIELSEHYLSQQQFPNPIADELCRLLILRGRDPVPAYLQDLRS